MPDGVHAAVLAVKAPGGHPAADPVLVQPRRAELLGGDPSVLAGGDDGDCVRLVAHRTT
jgi:hypothetical protein